MLQDKKKNKVVHKAMRNVTKIGRRSESRPRDGAARAPASNALTFDTSVAYV